MTKSPTTESGSTPQDPEGVSRGFAPATTGSVRQRLERAGAMPPRALRLEHWKGDVDLASLRDGARGAELPEETREACLDLWRRHADLLSRARASREEPR